MDENLEQKADRIRSIKDSYGPHPTLTNTLESFYDMVYVTKRIAGRPYLELMVGEPDSYKSEQVPLDILRDLESLGPNRVLGNTIPDILDLSYDKVRESFELEENPPVSRYYEFRKATENTGFVTASLAIMVPSTILGTLLIGAYLTDPVPLPPGANYVSAVSILGSAIGFVFGVMPLITFIGTDKIYEETRNNLPQIVKARRRAFWKLHSNAEKADSFLEDYQKLKKIYGDFQ